MGEKLDLWMEHWIDVYKSRTAAEKRADRFWRTNFPAKRHRFKKQKVRFADGTKTTSAHRVLRKAETTTSPTDTSRARVGRKEMTSPTSTTTSTSQRQRDQDSTCDSELGKLVGARTNNHSTTRSIPDTAVYPTHTAVPELSGSGFQFQWKLHASAARGLAKSGQGYQDPVERQVRQ